MDAVLEALMRGASTHIEPQTRKTCVQVKRPLKQSNGRCSLSARYIEPAPVLCASASALGIRGRVLAPAGPDSSAMVACNFKLAQRASAVSACTAVADL